MYTVVGPLRDKNGNTSDDQGGFPSPLFVILLLRGGDLRLAPSRAVRHDKRFSTDEL